MELLGLRRWLSLFLNHLTLKTKNFGQFKLRTSVCPKFRRLITQARTPMVGKGYQKSASYMWKNFYQIKESAQYKLFWRYNTQILSEIKMSEIFCIQCICSTFTFKTKDSKICDLTLDPLTLNISTWYSDLETSLKRFREKETHRNE